MFCCLREVYGFSSENIVQSFGLEENLQTLKTNSGNEGGRSASFFYFSKDKNFLIKTISKAEKKFLVGEVLSDYHRYMLDHDDSLLSKIIGVFCFKFQDSSKVWIMLQANIFPKVRLIGIFDLKGSKVDRSSSKSSSGTTTIKSNMIYKDLDFLNTKKKLFVRETDLQQFKLSIFKDTTFLNRHNVMDYSLLLGISKDCDAKARPLVGTGKDQGFYYYVGIIDYLQSYNKFKQLEAFSKNMIMLNVPRQDISVISADEYADRFSSFVFSIMVSD